MAAFMISSSHIIVEAWSLELLHVSTDDSPYVTLHYITYNVGYNDCSADRLTLNIELAVSIN